MLLPAVMTCNGFEIDRRGQQLPAWVNDTLTTDELEAALKNHITTVMDRYRGKLFAVDVCVSLQPNLMLGGPDIPVE